MATREQASRLLSLPDPETVKGKRDGTILGCCSPVVATGRTGLAFRRRDANARKPLGAGGSAREGKTPTHVPLPNWVKAFIDEWVTAAGVESGCVFRAINKGGRVYGAGLTANVIWSIVQGYAAEIGVPKLARRMT